MVLGMPRIFRLIATIFAVFFVAPLASVVAEPFVSEVLRRLGVDTSKWAGPFMSAVEGFSHSPFYLCPTLIMIGMAIGAWIDAILRRRESSAQTNATNNAGAPIDRLALADRADELVRRLSALHGAWESERGRAWQDDVGARVQNPTDPLSHFKRTSTTHVDGKYKERYGEQCMGDVLQITTLAQKCIQLDASEVWWLCRGVTHSSDLQDRAYFFSRISARLRHSEPDIPLRDPRSVAPNPSVARQHQSPAGTEQKTPL